MNPQRLDDYLGHRLEAAQLACSYVEGLNEEAFAIDKRTQQAVMLNIIVLGEAATKISIDFPDFAARYADLQWKSMRGMRNGSRTAISTSISISSGGRSRRRCRRSWSGCSRFAASRPAISAPDTRCLLSC